MEDTPRGFEVITADGPARMRWVDLPGDGPPIVFLHGLGGASTLEYARVATHPGLVGHRRLLVDLLGFGASDHPERFDYTIAAQADVLGSFLDHLGLVRVILFGHSMGGAIACSLAGQHPEGVGALILSEANLDAGGGTASRAIAAQSQTAFVAHGYAEMLAEIRTEANPWAQTLALAWPTALHRQAVSAIAGVDPSWRDILYALDCPRCYIFGEASLPDPDADELPHHGVLTPVIPEAGHNMAWQNPDALGEAIAAFLHGNGLAPGQGKRT